jgi:O-antigen/teichoic acid export membrane protein
VTDTNPTTDNRSLRPDSLAASVVVLLVVSVVQRAIGFGRGVLFCRWLMPDELGRWDMAYSFLLMAAPLVVLGLPGSFGRYLERYRQQGQLRTFLRRTTIWTASLAIASVGIILVAVPKFSQLIFGRPDQRTLVILLAVSLSAVILHHFLEALFAALRKFRIVSTMHFFQSIFFAIISLSLLWYWRSAAESVIIGYGAACLISATGTLLLTASGIAEIAEPDDAIPHAHFWPPLLQFAIWVWVTNFLCDMFAVVDRYMLVHWSGLDNNTALAQVGHYHASRVVPLLFLSLAQLLANVVMPYLSHDWEAGNRQRVSDRLNFVLKLTSLGMLASGVIVLWASPLLFHVAFAGRYNDGLSVLPWTLAYCSWYGLLTVAQNYIWCAEQTKIGTLPYAAGLILNTLLNMVLIPVWGLFGAVLSTTIATAFAVAVLYWINHRAGMKLQQGMIWLTLAPAALCGGAWWSTAMLVAVAVVLPFSQTLFTRHERELLTDFAWSHIATWRTYWTIRAERRRETSRAHYSESMREHRE